MTKRRRAKKYRPREVRVAPIVAEAALGAVTDHELDVLQECATRALDLIQLGSAEIKAYVDIEVTLRNLWVFASRFEQEGELRMLAMMGKAAMLFLYYNTVGKSRRVQWTDSPHMELTPQILRICCQPIQSAIDAYFDLARQAERRAEIIACQYASETNTVPFKARVFLSDGKDEPEEMAEMLHRKGVAYVHGRCEPGFFKKDALGRLVWRMPLADSQVVVTEPVLAYVTDDAPINNPEEL